MWIPTLPMLPPAVDAQCKVQAEFFGGPIIAQKAVAVRPDDTPETLQKRIMEEAEWKLLPEAVRLFCEDKLAVEGRTVIIKE